MMNNDAPSFVPTQHQPGAGQWGTRGGGVAAGNRRGQNGVSDPCRRVNNVDRCSYFRLVLFIMVEVETSDREVG